MPAANSKTLSVVLGEDAWNGDADAIVSVDGIVIFNGAVNASHAKGGETVNLGSFDGTIDHTISVQFTNDAYGGTPSADRNLYVDNVLVNGTATTQSAPLFSNGTATFTVPATPAAPTPAAPTPIVVGSGPDTVALSLSEDAWNGDAQFVLLVDGQQVGGTLTATAAHGTGAETTIDLEGNFSAAPHTFGVQFVNDAYGGTASTDRNLYLDAVSVNGADQNVTQSLFSNGTASFTAQAATSIGTGPDTVQIVASEDAWSGDAQMTVSIDGVQVGNPITVTASHAAGATDTFLVHGDFGAGSHNVSVAFTNDAWGGTASTDRNLYVQSVSLDGATVAGATGPLFSNGAVSGTASIAGAPTTSTANSPPSSSTVTPTPVTTTPVTIPPAALPPVTPPQPAAPPLSTSSTPANTTTPPSGYGADSTVGLIPVGAPAYAAGSPIETVGVGKQFATIGAAVAAAGNGTVILVDAGTYTNDFATNYSNISLIAVGGRVTEIATVPPPNYKGLITTEADLTVEGFDFEDVRIPDEEGHNGAGIRDDQGSLVLENDQFIGNQDGILTNAGTYSITIDHSVFNDNGGNDGNGAGNIHNVYIGDIASVTATNSVFENAQVGHEFKSRANVNTLTNNLFVSGVGIGTGSYDIDLPDGGKDTVAGNTIIKGPNAENNALLHFGGEGIPYAGSSLTVTGNLFESDGNPQALAILNQTAISASVTGNEFDNIPSTQFAQGPATINNSVDGAGAAIANQSLVGVLPGSTYFATGSAPATITLDGSSYQAAQGGAGLLTVNVNHGHIVVIGGTGGIDIIENPNDGVGADQYTTVAGSTNILDLAGGGDSIDSEGNDTIFAGDGDQSGTINGTATISGALDDIYTNSWSVNGTATINTGADSTFINLGASANVTITGTNSYFAVTSNGGNVSWNTTNSGTAVSGSASVGAFSLQAFNGVMQITTVAGTTGATLHLDEGGAHVISLGPDTIYAGSGNANITVSGAANVYAGTGTLELFGHADSAGANLYGSGGDYTIAGDTGKITYHGGALASTVEAQLDNITLLGETGLLTVNGGSRDTIKGGSGGLVLNDFGNGANTVLTSNGATDHLNLSGTDAVYSYGNDTITLDSGDSNFYIYGRSSLLLEDGNSTADLWGNDTVTTTAGAATINAHLGANVSLISSATDTVNITGATLNVAFTDPTFGSLSSAAVSGSGTATVTTAAYFGITVTTTGLATETVTSNSGITVNANGSTAIHLGAGTSTVNATGTGDEIWAGSGALSVNDYDANGGSLTIHGGSGSVAVNQEADTLTFLGGSGSATLSGSGVFNIVGGSGNITAHQNYGLDIASFIGGSGTASLQLTTAASDVTFGTGTTDAHELGWGSADTFHFLAGMNGADTVENFRIGTDIAKLGAGVSVASASVQNGAATFTLTSGAHVTFAGLTTTNNVFS